MRKLLMVLALVIAGVVPAAVAHAGEPTDPPPGGFGSWEELFAMQQRLVAAADLVSAATVDDDGLAGISAKPERRELWVYWQGEVPGAVAEAVKRAQESVPVRIIPARHSRAELLKLTELVAEQKGVTVVGPLGDGSGLRISTVDDESLDAVRSLAAVRDAGVALSVKASRPVLASRQSSASPHYGGAKFTKPVPGGYSLCTTGFAIQQGRARRMLTAGHCGDNGDVVSSGSGATMGTVSGDNNTKDTMLIGTNAAGRVYTNGYNSATSKPVHMALNSYDDTLVCTSGSMTGEHCKIRIINQNLTINVGYLIHPVVETMHDDGNVAAGEGDSGGPVVAQDSGGPFGAGDFVIVYAMGTITAIDLDAEVSCGSSYLPTVCSSTMFYVDVTKSLTYYNATIVTG